MFNTLYWINAIFMSVVSVIYFNQIFNLIVSIFTKVKKYEDAKESHNYAYLICARNEEGVIGDLVNSIYSQDYPKELMHVFVVADNSLDATAINAKNAGAIVFERTDKEFVGKSYAMDWALNKIINEYSDLKIEAFIILDADNLVDKDFTKEMNKAFDYAINNKKTKVITGFRSSKNFKASWISADSSYLQLREARQMHHSRSALGVGTYVSGTGYLVDYDVIKNQGGWPYHTLVEDIEISTDLTTKGEKILFCEDAIFYDEQPTTLKYSWRQRMRWCRGTHQVFKRYFFKLLKSLLKKPTLTKWGMLVHILPLPALSFLWVLVYMFIGGLYSIIYNVPFIDYFNGCMLFALMDIAGSLALAFLVGIVAMIEEWKKIDASWFLKILYLITFPIFMGLYLPITTFALFVRVRWKEIKHVNYDKKKA